MNYLDIIIALPLLWAVFKGFTKGFIIALASLVALIAGVYGAIHFSEIPAEYLDLWFSPNPVYLPLISFAITFLIIVGIVYFIAFILDRIIQVTGLGIINRLAGVAFNLLKMAFILSVIISLFNYAGFIKPLIPETQKQESVLYGPISKIAPAIFPYLNFENIKERFIKKDKTIQDGNSHTITQSHTQI